MTLLSLQNAIFTLSFQVVDLRETSEVTTAELLKEISMLRRFQGSSYVIQMLDSDRKVSTPEEDQESVDSLYILMERGECDLSHILDRLAKEERLTPAKLR